MNTPQGQVPADTNTAIGAVIPRYKIGYRSDEWGMRSSTPGGVSDPAGQWVRYDDHIAALASAPSQPVAEPAHTKDALIATMLYALTHARKALNHNNLALECGPVNSAILAARASHGQAPACQHRIVDARNPIIKSGYVCLDCGALFAAGDHDAAQAPSVLEDAARYRHIRDVPHNDEVRSVLIHQQNAVMDRVIDKDRAALAAKKGDAHE